MQRDSLLCVHVSERGDSVYEVKSEVRLKQRLEKRSFSNNSQTNKRTIMSEFDDDDINYDEDGFADGVCRFVVFSHSNGGRLPDSSSDSPGERRVALWREGVLRSNKRGDLQAEKKIVLDQVGFPFPAHKESAMDKKVRETLSALKTWKAINGVDHAIVPRSAKVDGINLGGNIHNLRCLRKKYNEGENTRLTADHIETLDAEGMVWMDANDQKWHQKYALLQEFQEENLNCDVPQAHPELGQWVNNQRKAFSNGKLHGWKVELLNDLGFRW
jgi:hypothetical protein